MTAGSHHEKDAAADGARESSERQERTENENSDDEVEIEEIEVEEEEEQREDLVWYFSYGSNMNPEVFEKKRGIRCLDHRVCTAPGYVLSYSESLLPWCEPAFCTCLRRSDDLPCCRDKPDIHGVAFLITWEQYEHVLLTEGGWGYQEHRYDPLWSVGNYGEEEIECVEIEPEKTTESESETEASEASAATSFADAGRPLRRFKAMTLTGLLSDLQLHDANCSKRYYDIVNEGARSSGLPASYRDYLRERHPAYEMSPCWRAKLAMILYWTAAFPCVLFECFTAQLCMGRNERKLKAKEAAAAAAAEKTTATTNDPATTTGDARTVRTPRRRFETVARPPWILLKLCYLYKCVVLERVMLPLLTDLCKLPSGYRNRCSAGVDVAKTTVDDAAETGR